MVTVDRTSLDSFLPPHQLERMVPQLQAAWDTLWKGTGAGNDFLGWRDLPVDYDRTEFQRIQAAAQRIQADSDVLVVIGIGGSYLGARAVIELLQSPNYNLKQKTTPDVYFTGNTLSTDAVLETLELIGDRDFSINVISKSGTTTEPAVAFRIFRAALEVKYGKEAAAKRIYATTDRHKGALKTLADAEGYESFVVPDDVGGRYSVLTAVGLLPIAVAGIDIHSSWRGAADARVVFQTPGMDNPVWQYAAARNCHCTRRAKRLRFWAAMILPSDLWPSGGSSSMARARGRKARASSQPAWSLPPISIPWGSISRRESGSSLRPS